MQVVHYFDYKSPYAYLAQAQTFALETEFDIRVDIQPYTLDIPAYLGAAELDADNQDTIGSRNAHQWRRVRYSYMDCRREANRRGLTIRGPRKIFDSSLAHIGFLFAKHQECFRAYHDYVFEKFWKRDLDIERMEVVEGALRECGVETTDFANYVESTGRTEHDTLRSQAESEFGVFGVPSYVVQGELFWGAERLELVRERLAQG
ncbi:MAG: DsbA family protein [Gammaproteobacteria bacterium]|nr:DsbA family protein [Gammaproteobacteria bacterium]